MNELLQDYIQNERETLIHNGFMPRLHNMGIRPERFYRDYFQTYVEIKSSRTYRDEFLKGIRYLPKMLKVAKWVNTDLLNDFTVLQVAKKLDWHGSLVWEQSMVNANDFDRFKALQYGYITRNSAKKWEMFRPACFLIFRHA